MADNQSTGKMIFLDSAINFNATDVDVWNIMVLTIVLRKENKEL